MSSWDHEGVIELFRREPKLVAELLGGPLRIELPPYSGARVESGALTQLNPAELRADLVIALHEGERATLGVVLEMQRERDEDKLFSWPAYVTSLRQRLRCEVCLVVVTQHERVQRWASRIIVLGRRGSFQPLVLGPSSVPVVDTLEEARRAPELAVLSAVVHGASNVDIAVKVALAAAGAAQALDRDHFLLYFGLISAALSAAGRKAFQMDSQGQRFFDESQRQSFAQGEATGEARGRAAEKAADVLDVLDARGLDITDAQRQRVLGCSDLQTLARWHRRAVTVSTTDALFEE